MMLMDLLDDYFFGPLNVIGKSERLLRGMVYRDVGYKLSIQRSDKGGDHTVGQVQNILNQYGVVIYSHTHDSQNMHFCVKERQARWAEYLLLNAGVDVTSPLFDQRNPSYAASHEPGWMPTPWSEKGKERAEPAKADPALNPDARQKASFWRVAWNWLDE